MFALALLAAAAAGGPQPGPIKAFGDWVVACDNVHSCEMTSLMPGDGIEPSGDEYSAVALSVARTPGPAGGWTVEVMFSVTHKGEAILQADGEIVGRGVPRNDSMVFSGAVADRIVAKLIKAKELTVGDSADTMVGRVSLAGSSAALRFIDADQGRAGTVTAAVAKGNKSVSAVTMVAQPPVIRSVPANGKPIKVTPALKTAMNKTSGCEEENGGSQAEIETAAIGGGATLALLPCGAGAYNFMTIAFVITGGKPEIAKFDFAPGMTEEGDDKPMLVNAGWDAKTAHLSSYSKGRGVGDCGSSEDYVWDGTRFRLVEAHQMIECRGSVNWLRVWRATPAAQ